MAPKSSPELVGTEEEEGVEGLGAALLSTNGLHQTQWCLTMVHYDILARTNGDGGHWIDDGGGGDFRRSGEQGREGEIW